jgi:hypothetical protein
VFAGTTVAALQAAVAPAACSGTAQWNNGGWSGGWRHCDITHSSNEGSTPCGTGWVDTVFVIPPAGHEDYVMQVPPATVAVSTADLKTAIQADVTAYVPQARDVVVAAATAIDDETNDYINTGVPPMAPANSGAPSLPASDWNTVKDALKNGVNAQNATVVGMVAQDVVGNAGKDTITGEVNAGTKPLTQAETTAAVKDALDQEQQKQQDEGLAAEGSDLGAPQEPQPPEKKSWTGVTGAFLSGLSSLPVANLLTGAGISTSNLNSTISLPLGSLLGSGQISINFADYEWLLTFLGAALHAMVGIRWTMWLFEG